MRRAWNEVEPLWVAALALLMIVPGYQWGPAIIRFFGWGGQTETVESLVYVCVLFGFPIAAALVGYLLRRKAGARAELAVKATLLVLLAVLAVAYASTSRVVPIAAAAGLSLITIAILTNREELKLARDNRWSTLARLGALMFVGIGSWMSAGALVSWADATAWFTASAARFALFMLAFGVALVAMRDGLRDASGLKPRRRFLGLLAVLSVALLVALSFRTKPVIEFYHWEFYIGPMQGLRQGGWLLWDTPAQYGLLPVLIPALCPGDAWQSFYLFQGICNTVVALLMFRTLRGIRPTVASTVLAAALTAATLFFRPRTGTLLLAGQMTPSGGPVRFIWCFVMLAFLFRHYREVETSAGSRIDRASRFAFRGNLIWLASVLWSVEAAIYCSAIWFPAYGIHLLQRAVRDRRGGKSSRQIARQLLSSIAWPAVALAVIVAAISAFYRLVLGHFPDWMGYLEYALLYGTGFRNLPIDPSGPIWFLLIVFCAISTAAVIYLCTDRERPRVVVLAGAWGGAWAIGSYFVSRSHPANLLSIAPFLVFAAVITLGVLATEHPEWWHGLVRVAIVPILGVPIALTIGHPGFREQITTPQLSWSSLTEQVPLMEPRLNDLLLEAGAKPSDPVVRIGDGRLVLPAWRRGEGKKRIVSPYSWLPKPYEIIGTLPASRRRKYIDRNAEQLRLSGWLVHSKSGAIADFAQQIADISRTHVETKRFENEDWIVSWYQLKK